MQTVIRTREETDLSECVAALHAVHEFDGYPSSWPSDAIAWLTPQGLLQAWVARIGSSLAGHIAIGETDPVESPHFVVLSAKSDKQLVEIKRLFVAPSFRARGVGEALLEAALSYAKAHAFHSVLEVTADRLAAIRLYERGGWRRIGTAPAGWRRASGERPLVHHYEAHE